jgi:hypothetical protein
MPDEPAAHDNLDQLDARYKELQAEFDRLVAELSDLERQSKEAAAVREEAKKKRTLL